LSVDDAADIEGDEEENHVEDDDDDMDIGA
jgi:hypothetical protein